MAGVGIAFWTLLTLVAASAFFFAPGKDRLTDAAFGAVIVLLSGWCLMKAIRLMTGRQVAGGLMSPFALRVISIGFLLMPVAALFTGFYREQGLSAIEQATAYVAIFCGLQIVARRRATAISRPR